MTGGSTVFAVIHPRKGVSTFEEQRASERLLTEIKSHEKSRKINRVLIEATSNFISSARQFLSPRGRKKRR